MNIKVYGASWCADCIRSKFILDQNNIEYEYIDIDNDEKSAKYVEEVNNGNRSIPTIVFEDGTIMVEPSNDELLAKLGIEN